MRAITAARAFVLAAATALSVSSAEDVSVDLTPCIFSNGTVVSARDPTADRYCLQSTAEVCCMVFLVLTAAYRESRPTVWLICCLFKFKYFVSQLRRKWASFVFQRPGIVYITSVVARHGATRLVRDCMQTWVRYRTMPHIENLATTLRYSHKQGGFQPSNILDFCRYLHAHEKCTRLSIVLQVTTDNFASVCEGRIFVEMIISTEAQQCIY